jgi:c-di-GMP-binding flagellar brake protein YcgR
MIWDSIERRQYVRVKIPCEIFLNNPQKRIISTHAEDISADGIRIVINERLEISSIVDLDIYAIKERPIACQGKIIWVRLREDLNPYHSPLFETGIEFYKIKNEDLGAIKDLIVSIASGI